MCRLPLLLVCCFFLVGCGQSYEEALQTLNNEVGILERLEKERAAIILERNQEIAKSEYLLKAELDVRRLLPSIEDDIQYIEKAYQELEEVISLKEKFYAMELEPIESQIEKQTKRVQEAKLARDKLK